MNVLYHIGAASHAIIRSNLLLTASLGTTIVIKNSIRTQGFWTDIDRYGCTFASRVGAMAHSISRMKSWCSWSRARGQSVDPAELAQFLAQRAGLHDPALCRDIARSAQDPDHARQESGLADAVPGDTWDRVAAAITLK